MSQHRLVSGHEIELLNVDEMDEEAKNRLMYKHGMVRILPEGWVYPAIATTYLDRIQNMKFRADDVIVMTFPKSGTTWMQEILWTMLNNPDLDPNNNEAEQLLWIRSLDMSLDMLFDNPAHMQMDMESLVKKFNEVCPGRKAEDGMMLPMLDCQPSPRVIKTHYPLDLLPKDILKKCKVVYVTRNPKDVMVSFCHFLRMTKGEGYHLPQEKLARELMKGKYIHCPYWSHVKQAWQERDNPNLHFTFYEDMKDDIMEELHKLNRFLGTNLTEQQLRKIAHYTSFSSMKARGEPIDKNFFKRDTLEQDGGIFRKGCRDGNFRPGSAVRIKRVQWREKGDWKNHFSAELSEEINTWIRDNTHGTDIALKYGN